MHHIAAGEIAFFMGCPGVSLRAGHVAHQNSWQRIVEDLPQYLAEAPYCLGTTRASRVCMGRGVRNRIVCEPLTVGEFYGSDDL